MADSARPNFENGNVFEDLSGVSSSSYENPYNAMIDTCGSALVCLNLGKPSKSAKIASKEIQARYARHRDARNAAQREKFFSKDFPGVSIDPILHKLVNPERYPDFADTRNCLVFWARPPRAVKTLIADLQQQLRSVAPSRYPPERESGTADDGRFMAHAYRESSHDSSGNYVLSHCS